MTVNPDAHSEKPDGEATFVGRSQLLAEIGDAVGVGRPVALYGPPGVGKSRAAREFARRWSGRVVTVDVASLRSAESLVAAVTDRVGVSRPDVPTLDGALDHLARPLSAGGATLLVLDDLDGVPDVAEVVARLAESACVLATARRPIDAGEQLFVGLLTPEEGAALYVAAARSTDRDIDDGEARELARALDGLPLAIELAASRAGILGPREFLARLDDRFELLRRRGADGTEALESALAWAWERISEQERLLAARLARVGIPVDLDVVKALADGDVDNVYDALQHLVDEGWVVRDEGAGKPRFSLYNTHAAFATLRSDPTTTDPGITALCETLADRATALSDAMETAEGKHALGEYLANAELFRWGADELVGRRSRRGIALVRAMRHPATLAEPPYLYARLVDDALAHARELDAPDSIVDLGEFAAILAIRGGDDARAGELLHVAAQHEAQAAAALRARLLTTQASLRDGVDSVELLESAAAELSDGPPLERALVARRTGELHLARFELRQARQEFELAAAQLEALPLFQAETHAGLAAVSFRQGRLTEAVDAFERVARDREASPSAPGRAAALFNLGVALQARGDLDRAEDAFLRAREIWLRLNDGRRLPAVLARLGIVQLEDGRDYAARTTLDDARVAAESANDGQSLALALAHLALVDGVNISVEPIEAALARSHEREPDVNAACHLGRLFADGDTGPAAPAVEELLALLADEDDYYEDVLGTMLQLARALDAVVEARNASDGHFRQRKIDEAVDHLRDPFGLTDPDVTADRVTRVRSPFVRLFARRTLDLLATRTDLYTPSKAPVLTVHTHCHWYRMSGGDPVDVSAKKANRLILKRILQAHLDDPQSTVDIEDLMEAGWPGESMTYESGRNRVYAAIRFLRDNQLRDVIETTDDGYRVAPHVRVKIAPLTGLKTPD